MLELKITFLSKNGFIWHITSELSYKYLIRCQTRNYQYVQKMQKWEENKNRWFYRRFFSTAHLVFDSMYTSFLKIKVPLLEKCIKVELQFHPNKFQGLERNIQKNLYERGSNWYELMYSFLPAICIISLLITKSGLHEYMHAGRQKVILVTLKITEA